MPKALMRDRRCRSATAGSAPGYQTPAGFALHLAVNLPFGPADFPPLTLVAVAVRIASAWRRNLLGTSVLPLAQPA